MATLTKAYIQAHRNTTHTYAAFGKLVIDTLLDKAEAELESASADALDLQIEFQVSPFEGHDCIRICLRSASGDTWCTNQFTDAVFALE